MAVEGLSELMARLNRLRSDSDRIIERGLLRAGERVRNRAVLLCPVKTGALRNSIQVEQPAPLTVSVGTNLEYGIFVEFGTGALGDPAVPHTSKESWRWQDEDGEWHTGHPQAARPFLRPAVDRQEIENEIAQTIRRELGNG